MGCWASFTTTPGVFAGAKRDAIVDVLRDHGLRVHDSDDGAIAGTGKDLSGCSAVLAIQEAWHEVRAHLDEPILLMIGYCTVSDHGWIVERIDPDGPGKSWDSWHADEDNDE
jgi:hypothetical protein